MFNVVYVWHLAMIDGSAYLYLEFRPETFQDSHWRYTVQFSVNWDKLSGYD